MFTKISGSSLLWLEDKKYGPSIRGKIEVARKGIATVTEEWGVIKRSSLFFYLRFL